MISIVFKNFKVLILKYSNEYLGFNLLFEKGNDKECFCSNQVPDGCIYSENKIRNVKICQNRLKAGCKLVVLNAFLNFFFLSLHVVRKLRKKVRYRHAFSDLDSFIGKPPQIRFKIEICAIKNPIVKKNRIKKAFFLQ